MPTEVILPRVDMDMTEGLIAAWHVHEGDTVRAGAVIFEIETSKATMEVDAPASGVIRHISTPVGESVPVGTPVAWIYADGEAVADLAGVGTGTGADAGADPATALSVDGRLRATPAARRLARERGLRLQDIAGSGPHGRIGAHDVPGDVVQQMPAAPLHRVWLHGTASSAGTSSTSSTTATTNAPLVLLHGFAAELNSWRPFCRALTSVVRAAPGMLALDLPAHGKSSGHDASSLEAIVAAVDATIAAERIAHCHLVGHSFGGAIALATAAHGKHAQTIRSLTLIAPASLGPDSNAAFMRGITEATRRASFAAWLKELFADPSRLDDAFIATAEQQLAGAEVRARLAGLADTFFPDGAQSLDLRGALGTLTIPVRVIWGLQDRILPARHANGLPGRVAVHRFAHVGHLPQIEALDDVAAVVAQNIASAAFASQEKETRARGTQLE